jgi:hypothetical protein
MLWMMFAEILPDALAGCEPDTVASVATVSAAALEAFRMALAWVEESSAAASLAARAGGEPALLAAAGKAAAAAAAGGGGGLSGGALVSAAIAVALAAAALPGGAACALGGIGRSSTLRGDGARLMGASHGGAVALGCIALARAIARGQHRGALVGALLGAGGAWGARRQLGTGRARARNLAPGALHAREDGERVPSASDLVSAADVPSPSHDLRSALFVACASAVHAAAEGLAMGAAAGAAADAGHSVWRALAPQLLPGAARGAIYAAAVFGISHSARNGMAAAAAAAAVQQARALALAVAPEGLVPHLTRALCNSLRIVLRATQLAVFAALVGPREWAVENGVVDRASCLAVRAHVNELHASRAGLISPLLRAHHAGWCAAGHVRAGAVAARHAAVALRGVRRRGVGRAGGHRSAGPRRRPVRAHRRLRDASPELGACFVSITLFTIHNMWGSTSSMHPSLTPPSSAAQPSPAAP